MIMKTRRSFVALLLCNLFLRAQQAYFSSKPPSVVIKATIGHNITFNWLIHTNDSESLKMLKLDYSRTGQFESSGENIAFLLSAKDSMKISSSFEGRVSVKTTGALTLYNVTAAERGFYKCEVHGLDRFGQLRTITDEAELFVGAPPVIYSSPASNITLLEDDHVNVSCLASGSPNPDVWWYKQTPHVWKKLSERTLRIENAKVDDSGEYLCRATNFMDTVEKTVKLTIYERPLVTEFFHNVAPDDTIYECDAITFTCEVSAHPPVNRIYIYHESRLIDRSTNPGKPALSGESNILHPGVRRGQIRIAEIRKEDEGKYFCVAENDHGMGYNKTIELKIYDAPKNCERKRALHEVTSTATQRNTSMHRTASNGLFPTTKKNPVWELRSNSEITRPNLLLLGIWFCHLLACNVPL